MAQVTTIDMSDPDEYELVPYPSHYGQAQNTDNVPANNPITNEGASLGRVLFYDTELSQNRTISCASCHVQSLGFTDSARFSTGYLGGKTAFHSMRLGNGRFYAPGLQFWDRRSISLEDQSTQPIQDHIEMGFDSANGGFDALIQQLDGLLYYRELFAWAFGDAAITEDRIQKALGQFVPPWSLTIPVSTRAMHKPSIQAFLVLGFWLTSPTSQKMKTRANESS